LTGKAGVEGNAHQAVFGQEADRQFGEAGFGARFGVEAVDQAGAFHVVHDAVGGHGQFHRFIEVVVEDLAGKAAYFGFGRILLRPRGQRQQEAHQQQVRGERGDVRH
jgi:hypothetical protein